MDECKPLPDGIVAFHDIRFGSTSNSRGHVTLLIIIHVAPKLAH